MNDKPQSIFTGLCLMVFLAGSASTATATEAEDAGQDIATENCARCHAVTATGASPLAEAPPFRTFKSKWPLENLEEALAEGIVTGHTMPMFEFGPDQIIDLLAYIDALPSSKD